MGQISAYQEAPYQGVSQAPPQVRRRDQAEALEDCLTAIPQGLEKRPPFQYLGSLQNHEGHTNGVFHHVERSAGDALYTLTRVGANTVPRVYLLADLSLQALTIDGGAQTYINTSVVDPHHDIGCNTVVDHTFTWNRKLAVANSATLNATRPYEGIVWVRGGAYGRTYQVQVNYAATSVNSIIRTPDGTTASDAQFVDTDVIATALVNGAASYPGGGVPSVDGSVYAGAVGGLSSLTGAGFTVNVQGGAVISISHPTQDFTIIVLDGQGGSAMVAAKGTVQKFSDLPAKAPANFTVKVVQQSGTNQDDYWIKFTDTAGQGTGVWTECLAPSAQLGLDKNYMPMGLIYNAGWRLQVEDWKQRQTGDQALVKDPDFIGQAVEDVTFWQGRLGIVSGEGVTLSCADDPFQLYPRTLALVLDSDPIGRVNPAPGSTTFRYAIAFEQRLVLCGDTIQAQVTYDGVLTPLKASIDVMTQHELTKLIRPSAVNSKLYLASPKGASASGIYEVAVDRVTNVPFGEDLTTAAFRYLPAGIDRSAVCPVNYMVVYGVSGSSDLYCHIFRHSDQERIQNALERWHLPTGYLLGGMFFVNTTLYVLACKSGKAHVLKMDLSPLVLDADATANIQTFLDLKASEALCTEVYDAGTDLTTITLPYDRTADTCLVVRAPGATGLPEGYVPPIDAVASALAGATKLCLPGDFTAVPYYVGHKYASRWDLTRIYPLDANKKPLRNGRCGLRRITLDLAHTGYVRAEVTAGGRPVQASEFFGFRFDDPTAFYDTAPTATGRWSFPVMSENEQTEIAIVNDSPFGHSVLGFEWVGEFNPKSQRT